MLSGMSAWDRRSGGTNAIPADCAWPTLLGRNSTPSSSMLPACGWEAPAMRLLVLLLLTLPAAAQPLDAPLGTFARVGVPVLLTTNGEVSIAGWRWRGDGRVLVYPPQLPTTVQGADGRLELRAVGEGQLLVGVVGPIPLPNEPGVLSVFIRAHVEGHPAVAYADDAGKEPHGKSYVVQARDQCRAALPGDIDE